MDKVETKKAPAAIGPYSQAMISGGLVYSSGQIPIDPKTGELRGTTILEQAEQVFQNLAAVLEAAGSSMDKIVKSLCFLDDMSMFQEFNAVYEKHITGKPARSCVAVKGLPKGALVEVEVIAEL